MLVTGGQVLNGKHSPYTPSMDALSLKNSVKSFFWKMYTIYGWETDNINCGRVILAK